MTDGEAVRRSRGLGKRAFLVTWSIRLALWFLGFTRLVHTKIVNADVVPRRGAVILAANHTSMIDVLFILAALRRQAIAMAMAELWKSRLTRRLVEVLGQIPVVRGDSESGRQAMESAVHALEDGALVGIFPVRIINANKVLPLDQKVPSLRHTVYVVFGEPINPVEFDSVPELLAETADRITSLEAPAPRRPRRFRR
jgi:1-acyl-sn-glycerol-3-phosphate acyltransferase